MDDCYSKLKPSIFYEHMCYAVWDRKVLAKKCVKKSKKTPQNITVLTPKKRRVIRKHFVHYLSFYKYHKVLFNNEISKMNDYAHRAIGVSKRYLKIVEEHPILDDEAFQDPDVKMIEL